MRVCPFTSIASGRIASASTSTLPCRKCSACESNASPRTSLTKTWRRPVVAMIQIRTLSTSATCQSRSPGALSIFVSIVLLPKIQRAFFERVNIAHHQDRDEAEHTPEYHATLRDHFLVNDRPRIHEHDLEVEENEQHRYEIELHAEARLNLALRDHAALVGSILCWRASPGLTEQHADHKSGNGEADCNNNLQENRQIFLNHSRPNRLRSIT